MTTTAHIPATLDFVPVRGSLTHFNAEIGGGEFFSLHFDAAQPEGYQWRLSIWAERHNAGVFLHGHTTKDEAVEAARAHLGMD